MRIVVRGEVQGVFFRATTKEVADEMGLSGSVRNLSDGGVEIELANGEREARELLKSVKERLHAGRIEEIEMSPSEIHCSGFTIKM